LACIVGVRRPDRIAYIKFALSRLLLSCDAIYSKLDRNDGENKSKNCLFTSEPLAERDTGIYDNNRTRSKLGKGRCMSTKKIDFEAMSFDDLWSLHEQISQILALRITSEKRELERRLAVLNRSRGVIDAADGDSARAPKANGEARRKYPRVLPKYRNPQTSETWSGRGKQ